MIKGIRMSKANSEENRRRWSDLDYKIKVGKSISISCKGKKAWNKGLTKEIDERVRKNAEATSKTRKKLFKEKKIKPYAHWKGKFKSKHPNYGKPPSHNAGRGRGGFREDVE